NPGEAAAPAVIVACDRLSRALDCATGSESTSRLKTLGSTKALMPAAVGAEYSAGKSVTGAGMALACPAPCPRASPANSPIVNNSAAYAQWRQFITGETPAT